MTPLIQPRALLGFNFFLGITINSSAPSDFLDRADQFLITCPFKYLTTYDCPGCGFQRSVLALLHGHFIEGLLLYPPVFPMLTTFGIVLVFKIRKAEMDPWLVKLLFWSTGSVVMLNYLYKILWNHLQ